MSNEEKFEEVFGRPIDKTELSTCVIKCPEGQRSCIGCEYKNFWSKEYKENKNE